MPKPRSYRILCADDEPAIRDVLAALLRREGYTVETAPNGMEAWRKLSERAGEFELLITDNEMPGLTGASLVRNLREAGCPVKIIVFSASLTPDDEASFRSWQVESVVRKGAPIDELLAEVRRVAVANGASADVPDRGGR